MLLITVFAALAQDVDGDAWLAQVDAANNQGVDAHLVLELAVTDAKGQTVQRGLEVWQKGDEMRLVTLTHPPRLAGVSLLIPDGETIYLHTPAFGSTKRVTGDRRSDAFLGTDFSIEELGRLSWSSEYDAVVEADEGDQVRLLLTPEDPSDTGTVRMWVREVDHLPARIDTLDASGQATRRLTLTDVADADGRPLAHTLLVQDLVAGTQTQARVTSAAFDEGLDDAVFSLSALSR